MANDMGERPQILYMMTGVDHKDLVKRLYPGYRVTRLVERDGHKVVAIERTTLRSVADEARRKYG